MNKSTFLKLFFAIFLYSIVSVCSKLSSTFLMNYGLFSYQFILLVFCMFVFLGLYAIIWQMVLKQCELTFAYCFKSLTLIWSLIWAIIIFNESITFFNILGILIICLGIVVMNQDA